MIPLRKPALSIQLMQTVIPFTDLTEVEASWSPHNSGMIAAPSLWQTIVDDGYQTSVPTFLNPYVQQ